MRKKILVGLGALALALMITFNVTKVESSNVDGMAFKALLNQSKAEAESGYGELCKFHPQGYCYKTDCCCYSYCSGC